MSRLPTSRLTAGIKFSNLKWGCSDRSVENRIRDADAMGITRFLLFSVEFRGYYQHLVFFLILSHIHGGMSLLDHVYCTIHGVEKFVPYCIDDLRKYENVLLLRFMVMIHPEHIQKAKFIYSQGQS